MKNYLTLLAIMLVTVAQAQWTADTAVNTLVADSESVDMQALGTSTGETYVVSWKTVPSPTNYELRLQVLDAAGNQKLGADGILVNDQIPMSTSTAIWKTVLDADDNIYIGVTGTGSGELGFVFKLDIDGNHLWGENGVNVGAGYVVTPLPLSNGDTIVSWLDPSNGQATMQRYDATGAAVWASTQTITSGSGAHSPANFFEIDGGDFVVVFHKLLGGVTSNLYAQRFNADGESQWATAPQLSDRNTLYNRTYEGVQTDDAIFMSWFGPVGDHFDNYLQRVNLDGTLPWGINGSDFSTNVIDNETNSKVAVNEDASAIYVVARYTNFNQSTTGTFIQKFDPSTGARQFTDEAKEVFAVGSEIVPAGQFYVQNDLLWFLVNNGASDGANPATLEAVLLDENGDFVWTEETQPVATFAASKGRINFTAPVDGQSVAVFVEEKVSGQSKIYAQNIGDEALLGTSDVEGISLALGYKNPITNELALTSSNAIVSVAIYNVAGQKVAMAVQDNASTSINVPVTNLNAGVYFASVTSQEGATETIKVIKE